mmetsp:Transcript_10546/g.17695  ORF Transcript_10546/g.17695 Transcript_10546/m.17695 type:complete len:97 (+) Transcript_10546:675-965(+)
MMVEGKGKNDFQLEFSKSKRGLGDEYADELAKKLYASNADMFLENDLTGPDSGLKKEIESIFNGLMRNLNQLSNIHFTPKSLKKESSIRTQNVPAL